MVQHCLAAGRHAGGRQADGCFADQRGGLGNIHRQTEFTAGRRIVGGGLRCFAYLQDGGNRQHHRADFAVGQCNFLCGPGGGFAGHVNLQGGRRNGGIAGHIGGDGGQGYVEARGEGVELLGGQRNTPGRGGRVGGVVGRAVGAGGIGRGGRVGTEDYACTGFIRTGDGDPGGQLGGIDDVVAGNRVNGRRGRPRVVSLGMRSCQILAVAAGRRRWPHWPAP